MKLRRRFRFWLLVLIELSFAAVALATEQFWMLLIAGPVAALSWYLSKVLAIVLCLAGR